MISFFAHPHYSPLNTSRHWISRKRSGSEDGVGKPNDLAGSSAERVAHPYPQLNMAGKSLKLVAS